MQLSAFEIVKNCVFLVRSKNQLIPKMRPSAVEDVVITIGRDLGINRKDLSGILFFWPEGDTVNQMIAAMPQFLAQLAGSSN